VSLESLLHVSLLQVSVSVSVSIASLKSVSLVSLSHQCLYHISVSIARSFIVKADTSTLGVRGSVATLAVDSNGGGIYFRSTLISQD